MKRRELIKKIAFEASVKNFEAEMMLDTLVEAIINELKADREVNLIGFGTFRTMTRHARGGVDPRNPSERIQIPAVRVAKFKTGSRLKKGLKQSRDGM